MSAFLHSEEFAIIIGTLLITIGVIAIVIVRRSGVFQSRS